MYSIVCSFAAKSLFPFAIDLGMWILVFYMHYIHTVLAQILYASVLIIKGNI